MMKLMLSSDDLIKRSSSYQSTIDSSIDDEVCFHSLAIDYEMADSKLCSIFPSDVCCDKLQNYSDQIQVCLSPSSTENQLFGEFEDYFDWMEYERPLASEECSVDGTSTTSMITTKSSIDFRTDNKKSLAFPKEDMELEDQLSIRHLLKALGEAKENQYNDLADVISRRLEEKACLRGSALHRLAYYLIQSSNSNFDHYYLAQEAVKHYDAAFSLFYQMFPYGRLAHFVANSSIIEALPEDAKMIHIVDFDMGAGVQWPPLIEAISKKDHKIVVRLISLKWDDNGRVSSLQTFENAKKWLCEHATTYSCELVLKVEEMGIKELALEMKNIGNSTGRENWVAFNCMRGLPHMGKQRSYWDITEFLKVAHGCIGTNSSTGGILMFGSGIYIEEKDIDCQTFSPIFEAKLRRITALLESMELQMPLHFSEARVAMECLFVAPCLHSLAKMDEKELKGELVPKTRLGARKISKSTIAEAKGIIRETDIMYCIRTEGENENELVLSYRGTPLLQVSNWST